MQKPRTRNGNTDAPSEIAGTPGRAIPHEQELSWLWFSLRLTYGIVPLFMGLDKFIYLVGWWPQYLSPIVIRMLPITGTTFIAVAGIIEIAIGLLVFSPRAKTGAYAVTVWLALTATNLIATGRFADVAIRDIAMMMGAFTFIRLTDLGYRLEFKEALAALPIQVSWPLRPATRTQESGAA